MSNRAAIRYAKAIMDRVQQANLVSETQQDMVLIANTIDSNAELSNFVANPVFSNDLKQSTLLEIFSGINKESKFLIQLLAQNKRLDLLSAVANAFNKLYDQISGVQKIQVTTAFGLTPELESKVVAKAKEFTDKTLVIENIVDSSIIGGFILRIGDKQYNASIANKLQILKRELTN